MPKKSYSKRKHKNEYVVKSKSLESAKSNECTQDMDGTEPDFDKKFVDVYQSSYDMRKNSPPVYLLPRARDKFTILETNIDKLFHEIMISKDMKLSNIAICAAAYFNVAQIPFGLTNKTREFQLRENFLIKSLILVHKNVLHHKMVLTALGAYQALGNCRSKLHDEKRCKLFLQKAVNIYLRYTKNKNDCLAPFDPVICIGIKVDTWFLLEQQHTQLLYTFGEKLYKSSTQREIEKGLKYVHVALQKQLISKELIKKNFNTWIIRALLLVKKFAMNDRFIEAKHHLVAICFVFDIIHGVKTGSKELLELELLPLHVQSNYLLLLMILVKYLILLMNTSRNRLLWNYKDKFYKASSSESKIKFSKKPRKLLMFSDMEEKPYISWVPDNYILNYKEAKLVFVEILKNINIIKTHYVDGNCNVLFELFMYKYMSVAYAVLASYEQKENQIKLYKQRANVLNMVLDKALYLDQEVYKLTALQLGYIYAVLLGSQIDNFQLISQVNPEEVNDVNKLVKICLFFYESYLCESNLFTSREEDEYTDFKRINQML